MHNCDKKEAIEKIEEKLDFHIEAQVKSDEERMQYRVQRQERENILSKQVAGVKVDLDEHREAQQKHEKMLEEWMEKQEITSKKQDSIMEYVEKNLIPAHDREVNAENAKKYIKERAKNWSFWVGVMMGTVTLFWAFVYIFKKILGIDK